MLTNKKIHKYIVLWGCLACTIKGLALPCAQAKPHIEVEINPEPQPEAQPKSPSTSQAQADAQQSSPASPPDSPRGETSKSAQAQDMPSAYPPVESNAHIWRRVYYTSIISFGVGLLTAIGGISWNLSNVDYDCRRYRGSLFAYDEARCRDQPKDFVQYHSESAHNTSRNLTIVGFALAAVSFGTSWLAKDRRGESYQVRSCPRCASSSNLKQVRAERTIPRVSMTMSQSDVYLSGAWTF